MTRRTNAWPSDSYVPGKFGARAKVVAEIHDLLSAAYPRLDPNGVMTRQQVATAISVLRWVLDGDQRPEFARMVETIRKHMAPKRTLRSVPKRSRS